MRRLAVAAITAAAIGAAAAWAADDRVRPPTIVSVTVGGPVSAGSAGSAGAADAATGFVADDGRVVTVAHVLDGRPIAVDGRRATVLVADRRLDLAVLRVPGVRGPRPAVATGGDEVITAAGPRPARVVRRIEANLDGVRRPALELRADVAIGDSGAPVVTDGGAVAGIVFARSRARARMAYAVDAAVLTTLLE